MNKRNVVLTTAIIVLLMVLVIGFVYLWKSSDDMDTCLREIAKKHCRTQQGFQDINYYVLNVGVLSTPAFICTNGKIYSFTKSEFDSC